MSKPENRALQEVYAGQLAQVYRRLAGKAVADTFVSISDHVNLLAHELATLPLSPAVQTLLRSAARPAAAADETTDLRARSMLLQQLITEVRVAIDNQINSIQAALNKYSDMQETLPRLVAGATYQDPALNASLSQFADDVQHRLTAWADRLAENRYDQAAFRNLLVHDVLDIAGLAQVMSGAAEVGFKQQRARWCGIAAQLGVSLNREPPRNQFDLEALAAEFVKPIQLVYEKPGVLRSIAQALSRGKFQDKLAGEVQAGMARLRPEVVAAIAQAWQDVEACWQKITASAIETWLQTTAGADQSGCREMLTQLRRKLDYVADWQAHLQQLTPQQVIASWAQPVRQQAVERLSTRLAAESTQNRPEDQH